MPADFLAVNDSLVARRDAHRAALDDRSQARATIADPVTREIATMFDASERHDAHLSHLASLAGAVSALPDGYVAEGASERSLRALERARAQGNYSAIEALERELDRDDDEVMQAVIFAMLD